MRLPSGSAMNAIRAPGSGAGRGGTTGRAPRATTRSYAASTSATSKAMCPYPSRSAADSAGRLLGRPYYILEPGLAGPDRP